MATETLLPNSKISDTGSWIYIEGKEIWQTVNDYSDATFVSAPSTTEENLMGFENPVADKGTINSVTVSARCRRRLVTTSRYSIRVGTDYSAQIALTSSFATVSVPYALNPVSGLAWTWADIQSIECGIKYQYELNTSSQCYFSQMWLVMDYTPATFYPFWKMNS